MPNRALVVILLMTFFFACEREESLLYQEIEAPREVTVVEEEEVVEVNPNFIGHILGDSIAEDTIGLVIFSEEFRRFKLSNFVYDSTECEIDSTSFILIGIGDVTPGGNLQNITFNLSGRPESASDPFDANLTYITRDSLNEPVFFRTGLCESNVVVVLTEVTPERISGRFTGVVTRLPTGGGLNCTGPDSDNRPISATFSLPRYYCN